MRLLLLLVACSDPVCHFPDRRHCGFGSVGGCPADDGCNWCDCAGGALACTIAACAGSPCTTSADCSAGSVCAYAPGCKGAPGHCYAKSECSLSHGGSFCGCDGTNFTSDGACADRPHSGC
jgi:hypothetical protein